METIMKKKIAVMAFKEIGGELYKDFKRLLILTTQLQNQYTDLIYK